MQAISHWAQSQHRLATDMATGHFRSVINSRISLVRRAGHCTLGLLELIPVINIIVMVAERVFSYCFLGKSRVAVRPPIQGVPLPSCQCDAAVVASLKGLMLSDNDTCLQGVGCRLLDIPNRGLVGIEDLRRLGLFDIDDHMNKVGNPNAYGDCLRAMQDLIQLLRTIDNRSLSVSDSIVLFENQIQQLEQLRQTCEASAAEINRITLLSKAFQGCEETLKLIAECEKDLLNNRDRIRSHIFDVIEAISPHISQDYCQRLEALKKEWQGRVSVQKATNFVNRFQSVVAEIQPELQTEVELQKRNEEIEAFCADAFQKWSQSLQQTTQQYQRDTLRAYLTQPGLAQFWMLFRQHGTLSVIFPKETEYARLFVFGKDSLGSQPQVGGVALLRDLNPNLDALIASQFQYD